MKTTLKKLIGGAALGLALLANTGPTWAGLVSRVEITLDNTSARGSMVSARYSGDNLQYISCSTVAGGTNAVCSARSKTGALRSCYTYNPDIVAVVSAITDSSLIAFTTASGGSQCLSIDVNNSSDYLR